MFTTLIRPNVVFLYSLLIVLIVPWSGCSQQSALHLWRSRHTIAITVTASLYCSLLQSASCAAAGHWIVDPGTLELGAVTSHKYSAPLNKNNNNYKNVLQTINIHPTRPLLILQVVSSPQSVLSRRSLRNLNQLYYVNGPLRQYNSLKWNRTAVKNRTEDLLSLLRIWQTSDTFSSGDGSKYQRPLLTCRSSASSRTGNEPSQRDEQFG